jgi:putative restriction endonuclease
MIENYLHLFSNLQTDKARNRYSALTRHRAHRKPFLLLSVMDLIAHGAIAENFIEPSYELVDTFNFYWTQIMPPGSRTSVSAS